MGTILVAVAGVFVVLGMWMIVQLLADKYLGERSPGCGCGLHAGEDSSAPNGNHDTCGHCTVQLSEHNVSSLEDTKTGNWVN
ncbi:MAG: hypothetical protein ACQESR_24220 [Planctomycetota bacterium]